MSRKTTFIAVLVGIIISVIGVSTYLLKGKGEEQKEVKPFLSEMPVEVEDITASASWKTYKNEKYGFEFKYPQEYDEVKECKLKETENGVVLGEGRFRIEVELLKYEHPLEAYVTLFVAKEMQEYGMLEFSLDELTEKNLWIPVEKISIGSNEGFRVNLPGRPASVIFLSKGNKFYKITMASWGVMSCLEYAGYEDPWSYEQILSTFRLY